MSSPDNTQPDTNNRLFSPAHLWLAGILALGAALRLWHLGFNSLWEEEIICVFVASQNSLATLLNRLGEFVAAPPLDALVLWIFLKLPHNGDFVARLPAALWGIVALWGVYLLGRRLFGIRTGLLAAFLLAVSPFHLQFSQEVGPYTALAGLSCLSMLWFLKGLQDNSFKAWAGYILFTLLALYVHYFGLALPIIQVVFAAWARFESRVSVRPTLKLTRRTGDESDSRRWLPVALSGGIQQTPGSGWLKGAAWRRCLFSAAAALILFAPWVPFAIRYSGPRGAGPALSATLVANIFAALGGGRGLPLVVSGGLFVVGAGIMGRNCRRWLVWLLVWLLLPIPLTVAAWRVAGFSLSLGELLFILLPYLLGAAHGLDYLGVRLGDFIARVTRRPQKTSQAAAAALLITGLLLLNSFAIWGYYRSTKINWRELAAYVTTHLPPDGAVVIPFSNTGLTRREISLTTYLNGAGVPIIAIEDPLEELAGLLNEYHYLWLVNRASGSVFKVRNALEDANLPFVHLIFGRNNGKAFAQQIAPAAFEDMHLIYASDRFAPDDTLAGQTQTILLELDYQAVRQEFALADVTRRYGSNREDSLFLYDEALRDAPPYLAGHIYTVKGNIYRASGQINAAINNYETAVKINPRNAGAHYGLALGYEKRGQRVQAIAEWEAFLRLSPTGERAQTAREHLDTLRRRR